MPASRSVIIRTVSVLLLSLAVTACSAAGAPSAPGATTGVPTATAAAASTTVTASAGAATATPGAGTATPAAASAAASGVAGIPDCSGGQIGRKAFKMLGFDAQQFCGPATATVTVGGVTGSIASGWCETNLAGFTVSIGTQLFGTPTVAQQPDVLVALVDPTSGAGSISGVISHHGFLLTTGPVHYGPGKLSGTFSGTGIVGGAMSGSFACNS